MSSDRPGPDDSPEDRFYVFSEADLDEALDAAMDAAESYPDLAYTSGFGRGAIFMHKYLRRRDDLRNSRNSNPNE